MKAFVKGIAPVILTGLTCILLCSACTGHKPKTIVIENAVSQESASAGGQEAAETKVYQYNSFNIIDNQPVDEQLFGWIDNKNAADIIYKEKSDETTIESVNYKYHFTREIMRLTQDIANYSLSPDGSSLAWVKKDDALHFYLKNISTGEDRLLADVNRDFSISGVGIGWSKNGRYLTYSIYDYETGTYTVTICDLHSGESHQITLPLDPAENGIIQQTTLHLDPVENGIIQSAVFSAAVSDDGARLLISVDYDASYENPAGPIFLYSIQTEEFILAKRFLDSKKLYVDFLSANEVMFVDMKSYALCLYHIDNEETTVIGDDITYYKLSNDGKNIVYAKYSEEKELKIYTAELDGTILSNETQIYQGFDPQDIWWSQDKSRILLRGRFIHIYHTAGPALEANNDQSTLENIIIELNETNH